MTETNHVAIRDAGVRTPDQLSKKCGDIIRLEEIIVGENEKIGRCDAPQQTLHIVGPAENLGIDDDPDAVIPQKRPASAQYLLGWRFDCDLDDKVGIGLG